MESAVSHFFVCRTNLCFDRASMYFCSACKSLLGGMTHQYSGSWPRVYNSHNPFSRLEKIWEWVTKYESYLDNYWLFLVLVVVDWYYSYSDHYCIDHMNHTSQFLQIEQTTQNGFPSHNLWIINDESYFFINFGDPWLVWKLKGLCRSTLGEVKSIFLIIEWSIYNNDSIIETCFMDSRTVRLNGRLKRYVGP